MIAFGGEDNCINIWNIRSKEEVVILKGHSGTINSCSFSADDKQIISASSDETIKIWNLIPLSDSLTLAAHTSAITSSSFSPDGDQVVSTGKWDRNIKIWNTNKGETRAKLIGPKRSSIKSCAFSPDGKQIVSAHGYIIALWDIVSGNKIRYLRCGKGIFVNSCAFSPDGGKLVSGSVEGLIIIWDLNTGTQSMILSEGSDFLLEKCEFSPDGKYIISKGGKSINIWSLDSGNLAISISRNFLLFMLKEIFPDDKYFITGKRKTLALIDYQQTDEFLSLYGGNCILTNSCYIYNFVNYLKICDSVTLVEISKFYFEGFCNSFSVSPDGTIIACGDNIGNFYLLKLTGFSIGKPIDLSVKFFELLADLRLKISQGGWRNLSNKENLWNDEFEEERYEVEILNGEWKKIEDFKPF
jgi:WD40 repeat protein